MNAIGTLNEKPLHAALKLWYARPGDRFEEKVEGFVVDIVREDLLIEIQTGNFSSIQRKMHTLAIHHRLRLVYPIAIEKWIVRLAGKGLDEVAGRRRSPKQGSLIHVFSELVSCPALIANPNFSLEILLTREEEVRRPDRKRGWRRGGWVIKERRLLGVVDRKLLDTPEDLLGFIPQSLEEPWTTADLADAIGQPRWLIQKMVYCMRKAGTIRMMGKKGNAILYAGASC